MTAVCLFCDEAFQEAPKFLDHMKEAHHYDLKTVFAEGHFGFYDRVKFINYIRKLSHEFVCFVCGTDDLRSWQALRKHLANSDHLTSPVAREKWENDEYLIPTYDNDSVLCLLEDILEINDEDFETSADKSAAADEVEKRDASSDVGEKKSPENEETAKEQNGVDTSKDGSQTSGTVVIIPEDLLAMEDSVLANDPELRDLLK